MRPIWGIVLLGVLSSEAPAQEGVLIGNAAESIRAADMADHVQVLIHDSMVADGSVARLGRTADYVAEQLRQLGLAPGGDLSDAQGDSAFTRSWRQAYSVAAPRLNYEQSSLVFHVAPRRKGKAVIDDRGEAPNARTLTLGFDDAAYIGSEITARMIFDFPVVLVAGRVTDEDLSRASLRGKVVLYIPPFDVDSTARQRSVDRIAAMSRGVIVVSDDDSNSFARRMQAAQDRPPPIAASYTASMESIRHWTVYAWARPLGNLLSALEISVSDRRGGTAIIRDLPALTIVLRLLAHAVPQDSSVANVVGILPGRDSATSAIPEYVVISAPIDYARDSGGGAGLAEDNASGLATLLALAKAFHQPGARPRRSIVFLASSGTANGFLGSHYFLSRPPEGTIIANINLDLRNGVTGDTIFVDGLQDVEFATSFDWISAQHPELRLIVADGGSIVNAKSHHFAFVKQAIPSLHFHDRTHEGPAREAVPPSADIEYATRVARAVFYLVQEIADTEQRPRWTSEGRQRRLRALAAP